MNGALRNVSILDGEMTHMKQHRLKPMLRIWAALSLLVWLAATGFCLTECAGEDSHSESAQMEQAAQSGSQSHDSDKHDSHDDSLCVSLHSVCPVSPNSILVKPDFSLAFTLNFLSTAHLETVAQAETFIFRQPPDRQFVFTPEVCLGAAFRSLAPPVLA